MLKNWSKYVLVGAFSLIFIFAAAGHNQVAYCCDRCEAAAQHHTADNPYDDACQIIHLQIDDFSISTDGDVVFKAPVRDMVLSFATLIPLYKTIASFAGSFALRNPVYTFGRAILVSNCVFRI